MPERKKSVVVGMSGGVDSAVAALLLKEQGWDVTGVFMKNWDDGGERCTAAEDFEDVRAVCDQIGIPYYTVNFEQEYWDRVFTIFLEEYKRGRTPNPDVLCNREIKFAAFLDFALQSGAEYIATGHYARTEQHDGMVWLKKGVDANKDQSYFLCQLTQKQVEKAIFPLGDMEKTQVRAIAKERGLEVALKRDSTGICFIGERKFKQFLSNYLPANPGDIVTEQGKVVGRHDGLMYYTLGPGERWFVVAKDLKHNLLVVSQGAESEKLFARGMVMTDTNFIAGGAEKTAFSCTAKVRYRQEDQKAFVQKRGEGIYFVIFEQKQRAITPGQYCVLYDGDTCLGGGVCEEVVDPGERP